MKKTCVNCATSCSCAGHEFKGQPCREFSSGCEDWTKMKTPSRLIESVWEQPKGYAYAIFLKDGTKITVGRGIETKGRAWLKIGKAEMVGIPEILPSKTTVSCSDAAKGYIRAMKTLPKG